MKKYKFQYRSPKNSHACVPLNDAEDKCVLHMVLNSFFKFNITLSSEYSSHYSKKPNKNCSV
jgi:hypothetical protein